MKEGEKERERGRKRRREERDKVAEKESREKELSVEPGGKRGERDLCVGVKRRKT